MPNRSLNNSRTSAGTRFFRFAKFKNQPARFFDIRLFFHLPKRQPVIQHPPEIAIRHGPGKLRKQDGARFDLAIDTSTAGRNALAKAVRDALGGQVDWPIDWTGHLLPKKSVVPEDSHFT